MTSQIEIIKQQIEVHTRWSQFYHDAEIKVNSSAIIISSVALVSQALGDVLNFRVFGLNLNLIGIIIVLSSVSALISTFGYWRYYEVCDLYTKEFRRQIIDIKEFEHVRQETKRKFDKRYPILSNAIFVNAHHAVWIITQLVLLLLGVWLTATPFSGGQP